MSHELYRHVSGTQSISAMRHDAYVTLTIPGEHIELFVRDVHRLANALLATPNPDCKHCVHQTVVTIMANVPAERFDPSCGAGASGGEVLSGYTCCHCSTTWKENPRA